MRVLCIVASGLTFLLGACRERRAGDGEPVPTYAELAPLFERACASCHGAEEPAAGYDMTSYLTLTACTASGKLVVDSAQAEPPLVTVLKRPDHEALLSQAEQSLLRRWVLGGAPQVRPVIHGAGILDPRSPGWHGKLAATDDWAPLRDVDAELVCGRCHEGAPVQPTDVVSSVDTAPSCTSCHTEEAGALDCSTCHGAEKRAYPPRDACRFPELSPDAHAAHLTERHFRTESLACGTCHAVPTQRELFDGKHANGKVELRFDSSLAGPDATYAEDDLTCSVACHARGGERARPHWDATAMLDCNACHLSPPKAHFPGNCGTCHAEMGDGPRSLTVGRLHINGSVDLGTGDGTCSACHGEGKAGWPKDETHRAHRDTTLTRPVECAECHAVPSRVVDEGHLNGQVSFAFSGRALRAGLTPRFETDGRTCVNVACHATERESGTDLTPRWGEPPPVQGCASCHQTPPGPPHVQKDGCGGGLCHADEVAGERGAYRISEPGRASHLDGQVRVGGAP